MSAISYPFSMEYLCGHTMGSYRALPSMCPICCPTNRAKVKERLDQAYRVKPVIPSGQELTWRHRCLVNIAYAHLTGNEKNLGRCWQLDIDGWHPARLNVIIRHWSVSKRSKDEAIKLFCLAALAAGCPPATGRRVLHLRLEGFRVAPDADAFDKVVLDSLKRAGLITDDNADGVLGRMGFEAVLGKEKRTVLLIGDVA